MNLKDCPRCGWRAFEHLETHSYCIDCNYFEASEYHYQDFLTQPNLPSGPASEIKRAKATKPMLKKDETSDMLVIFFPETTKRAA